MPGRQVELNEFCAQMGRQERHDVEQALGNGMGVARYGDKSVTYGRRDAFFAGLPPMALDGHELDTFVAPPQVPQVMRSPLMDATMGPPQIRRPRVSPTSTEYPDVQFELRQSNHPRGNASKNGYIEVQRLLPGREAAEPVLPESEETSWWRNRLRGA